MIINGEKYDFENHSLLSIIEKLSLDSKSIIAEVNGEIIAKSKFESYIVDKTAVIELLVFVGGG